MVTKAMKVEEAYYNAAADKATLKSCHRHAVSTALNLGGIVIDNTDNSVNDFAPIVTFEFNDASTAEVTYGGVFCNTHDLTTLPSQGARGIN